MRLIAKIRPKKCEIQHKYNRKNVKIKRDGMDVVIVQEIQDGKRTVCEAGTLEE